MQFRVLVGLFLLLGSIATRAQSVSGKIRNLRNESLVGVTVKVIGTNQVASTDQEGNYNIYLKPGTKHSFEISYVGFQSKLINNIAVADKEQFVIDIVLEERKSLEGVTVSAKRTTAQLETAASIIQFQKNTGTVASVISAETIRRSPDKNSGEVLKRTPGVSLQDGKFLVVRGLADRYNSAMLNGVLLTSTEPDRKTFSFDLIPSSIIENIIINKAFLPEYPGEWSGGLILVNTKDFPAKNFFNIKIGTWVNSQTLGKKFFKSKGGKLDWLGIDDGARGLPESYKNKSSFDQLSVSEKNQIGKSFSNTWMANELIASPDVSFQLNGGYKTKVFGKKTGLVYGLLYNKQNRYQNLLNRQNTFSGTQFDPNFSYDDDKYNQEISAGAIAALAVQLNNLNKISVKSIVNIHTLNYTTNRNGKDYVRANDVLANEFTFKQNTFFTTQLTGEHSVLSDLNFKWYGAFNILDGLSPDQKRIQYTRSSNTQDPYLLLIGNSLSQESGSRIFQNLSDYIYTAGGDLAYSFSGFRNKQTLKVGYMMQIKDRLYDAKLFANYLPRDNPALRRLSADKIFDVSNFGNGSISDNLFSFDAIKGNQFRYLANTILNAAYLQFDNQLSNKLRILWGARVEHYDQLVGSVNKLDPRHIQSKHLDVLPGLNLTYKLNAKTNFRFTASQTVIRPEMRELSFLNLYDFELNASIQGNPLLKRSKNTNLDIRYELYPRSGEVITMGAFYKYFKNPIEQIFSEGSGGASTFSYQNPQSATAFGAEVEFRKKLDFYSPLNHFTLMANASYVFSKVKDDALRIDRPLQGQSPYLINLGLMYDLEEKGLNATLLFNQVGERIYLVGDLTAGAGSPDIYEAPRPVLDFQIGKKFLSNKTELRLSVSDILNQTQYFYQNASSSMGFNKKEDALRFTRNYGTSFSLSFSYSL